MQCALLESQCQPGCAALDRYPVRSGLTPRPDVRSDLRSFLTTSLESDNRGGREMFTRWVRWTVRVTGGIILLYDEGVGGHRLSSCEMRRHRRG